jgi:hypothetical protein
VFVGTILGIPKVEAVVECDKVLLGSMNTIKEHELTKIKKQTKSRSVTHLDFCCALVIEYLLHHPLSKRHESAMRMKSMRTNKRLT